MVNIRTLISGLSLCAILMTACNNEDTPTMHEEVSLEPQEFLNITYMGQSFENVPTAYDENGDFIFLDGKFAEIYQENLANDPDWSISIKGPNDIEFFSNLEENLKLTRTSNLVLHIQ